MGPGVLCKAHYVGTKHVSGITISLLSTVYPLGLLYFYLRLRYMGECLAVFRGQGFDCCDIKNLLVMSLVYR